ncbi:MAG: competence/damage-inducible protein A [Chlorobiaceae bacterium]
MRAEIVSVGDELLKGQRVNTNAAFIASALAGIGVSVGRIVTCSDDEADMVSVFSGSLERADIVLVTGGLGPTGDDRTKNSVQKLLSRGLELNRESWQNLEQRMRVLGREISPSLRGQAEVIAGSRVMVNTRGTAAGMIIDCQERFGNHHLVLMPGVPSEMKAMMELDVIPFFAKHATTFIRHTPVKTFGIGESTLSEMIAEVEGSLPPGTTLAYLPHSAGVNLTISTKGSSAASVEQENSAVVDAILQRAGRFVYATRDTTLEEAIGERLGRAGLTVAVAESCTGGLVASRLTDVPGASAWFLQGFVVYSNNSKEAALGVPKALIDGYGAVSEEVARAMASGSLDRSGADLAVATTGIAGPSGGTPEKPVGTLCIAIAEKSSGEVRSQTLRMHGDRELNKLRFSEAALRELWQALDAR